MHHLNAHSLAVAWGDSSHCPITSGAVGLAECPTYFLIFEFVLNLGAAYSTWRAGFRARTTNSGAAGEGALVFNTSAVTHPVGDERCRNRRNHEP
jgi:hypothetical protein